MNIEKIVKEILISVSDKEFLSLSNDAYISDLGIKSMDTFMMLFDLEDKFGIVIPDRDAMGWEMVSDIIEYIEKNG